LKNLVIIQNPERRFANDVGGCLSFNFISPVQMVDMGLLDVGPNTNVTVCPMLYISNSLVHRDIARLN
jgi:hypothetical protein